MNLNVSPIISARVNALGALITLLDNRTVDTDNVSFNRDIYHFRLNDTGEDITAKIRRRDKENNWTGFDATKDNERLYVENYVLEHGVLPPTVGSTSTWAVLANQLLTDPLGAPLEAADAAWEQVVSSTGVKGLLLVGGGLLALYFLVLRR